LNEFGLRHAERGEEHRVRFFHDPDRPLRSLAPANATKAGDRESDYIVLFISILIVSVPMIVEDVESDDRLGGTMNSPRRFPGLLLAALVVAGSTAFAEPTKEQYYFELKALSAKPGLTPEAVKMATPRVLAEAKKAFEHQPQIVAKLEGAPDPKMDPDGYRAYLAKAHIAGAFNVNIEITDAAEVLTPKADKPGAQELEIRLALRMLGSHIPDDTLGFTGHGKADIKQEVGAKPSAHELQETWDQVAEHAVSAAMRTALEELALAAKTKPKSKAKPKPAAPAPRSALDPMP